MIRDEDIELGLLRDLPLAFARGNLCLPVKSDGATLTGLAADDRGALALREIARRRGLALKVEAAGAEELTALINRIYGQVGSAEEVMERIADEDLSSVATEFERPRDILELSEEAPIIRLLNALLRQAVKERASDIHIEPYERDIEVRLRVDGVLRKVLSPPKAIQDALMSRVKILARLDIAERRLPQDGRIRLLIGGRDIDVRVSVVPTVHGERAVLRLLDRMQGVRGLGEVGLGNKDRAEVEQMLGRTNGIVLVTGPTGSGKTTTLYAALTHLHDGKRNIITIEDPVEYQLRGIGQIQAHSKIGLTFASGLRSVLRQDPDIIMVGEIRDRETAEIAIQASLTGHLVLSTLHTNDAPSAAARLVEMGVEPYLTASSLAGVLAQRLVRTVCPACREEYAPSDEEAAYFGGSAPARLVRGAGCDKCHATGYLGRTAVFELMAVTPDIRSLITSRADAATIRAKALQGGMRALRADGMRKAGAGVTSLEEVLRATRPESDAGI